MLARQFVLRYGFTAPVEHAAPMSKWIRKLPVSELHTHEVLTDPTGTEILEPEETIVSDEKPHEIEEKSFVVYNVCADIVESLVDAGITHPFPIQAMTLPVALSGRDIIGQATTGTG